MPELVADFLTFGTALSHVFFAFLLIGFSALLTRWVIGWNIADIPNARSSHMRSTPKSGGVAIAISFLIGMVIISSWHDMAPFPSVPFAIFLATTGGTFGAALADDLIELSPFVKLACQLAMALIFSLFVARIDGLAVPMIGNLTFGWFGHLITIGWFVLFMNVYNFMDGIDGLAAGGALIALFMLGGIGLLLGAHVVYLSALCLFAAVAGFFAFNFPPAKIFMGDTGSQVIGFAIAGLA
ncbi:MAG TPA: UDP-phosphate alpha-N-acetylglucosaminyl 1-phosphate transferase, partial [Alphaproteobacteria bacterium]|nr:UDP-phosphate alpha-N-acetylglucosaminyl 1-phosphate transferase [Alphaproteobacteria bacterium]